MNNLELLKQQAQFPSSETKSPAAIVAEIGKAVIELHKVIAELREVSGKKSGKKSIEGTD